MVQIYCVKFSDNRNTLVGGEKLMIFREVEPGNFENLLGLPRAFSVPREKPKIQKHQKQNRHKIQVQILRDGF